MLSMRKRGKAQIYYIRGTVTLGDRRIDVQEFSSGTSDRDAAAHLMATRENELREQLMFGPQALVAQVIIADAFAAYLSRPGRPKSSDILRIGKINEIIGDVASEQGRTVMRLSDIRGKKTEDARRQDAGPRSRSALRQGEGRRVDMRGRKPDRAMDCARSWSKD
jgi:hypothetical protein